MKPTTLLTLTFLAGCSTATKPIYIKSDTDLSLQIVDKKGERSEVEVAAGMTKEINGSLTHIEAPGRVPLIIVQDGMAESANSSENPWMVNLKKVEDWKSPATNDYISRELDQITVQLLDVLHDAKNGRKDQSLTKIKALILKNPKVSSLHYVKAQVELLGGKSEEALKSLNTALELNPGLTGAIILREKIK